MSTPDLAVTDLVRGHSGHATYTEILHLDYNRPFELPTCRSDTGAQMVVDQVTIVYAERLDGNGWEMERVTADGRYLHIDTETPGHRTITELPLTATWSPQSTRQPWLAELVDQFLPLDPPPGHVDNARRAAAALALLPRDALRMLLAASRNALQLLDDAGATGAAPAPATHLRAAQTVVERVLGDREDAAVDPVRLAELRRQVTEAAADARSADANDPAEFARQLARNVTDA